MEKSELWAPRVIESLPPSILISPFERKIRKNQTKSFLGIFNLQPLYQSLPSSSKCHSCGIIRTYDSEIFYDSKFYCYELFVKFLTFLFLSFGIYLNSQPRVLHGKFVHAIRNVFLRVPDSFCHLAEVGHAPRRWKLRARDIRHTLRLAGIKNAATRTSFIPAFFPTPFLLSGSLDFNLRRGLPAEFIEKMAMRMKWHALIRWIRDRCGSLFLRRHGQHLATSHPTRHT